MVLPPPLSLSCWIFFWRNGPIEDERSLRAGGYSELPILDDFAEQTEGKTFLFKSQTPNLDIKFRLLNLVG